jgi:ankyrin repeat protein
MLRNGADPSIPDTGGMLALHYAVQNNHINTVQSLLHFTVALRVSPVIHLTGTFFELRMCEQTSIYH